MKFPRIFLTFSLVFVFVKSAFSALIKVNGVSVNVENKKILWPESVVIIKKQLSHQV